MNELDIARACARRMADADEASRTLGISVEIPEPGAARATMRVREDMVNGFDLCHGGLIFTLADTAFAFACNAYNQLTVAASANIEFLRPAKLGETLVAHACEEHRGKRSGVYSVVVENDGGERIALFRGRSASVSDTLL
ncbi:MAG: hydroxyphenylacetyl-CoA thioesterase PaaI [Pseudomonadota bacterium]